MADWTVDEARAYLPRLRLLVQVIRRAAMTAARARSNGHGVGQDPGPGVVDPAEAPGSNVAPTGDQAPVEDLVSAEDMAPAQALAEVEQRGIVLRDLERGLVDFPSRHPSGRQVLLCWQIDEPDLAWWHLPEDGFAGRRPLPVPPEL